MKMLSINFLVHHWNWCHWCPTYNPLIFLWWGPQSNCQHHNSLPAVIPRCRASFCPRERWERSAGELMPPGEETLNRFPDRSGWSNIPALLCFGWDSSEVWVLHWLSYSPAEFSSVDNYGNYFLVNTLFLGSFPSLTHFPSLLQVFPKVTSQVYSWYSNLCLRGLFLLAPNQDKNVSTQQIY